MTEIVDGGGCSLTLHIDWYMYRSKMSTKYCDKLPTFLSHNITSIHSLHCPPQALYICTSLPDARPLEDDRR